MDTDGLATKVLKKLGVELTIILLAITAKSGLIHTMVDSRQMSQRDDAGITINPWPKAVGHYTLSS